MSFFHYPATDKVYVKKVLDSMRLPGGLVFPMVEDAATALVAVEAARYPPEGIRDRRMFHLKIVFLKTNKVNSAGGAPLRSCGRRATGCPRLLMST